MTPARLAKYKATLACRQLDLTIITDQVNKHQNIAALIRTCDAVGIHSAHVVTPMDNMDNIQKEFEQNDQTELGQIQNDLNTHELNEEKNEFYETNDNLQNVQNIQNIQNKRHGHFLIELSKSYEHTNTKCSAK